MTTKTHADWQHSAATLSVDGRAVIDGRRIDTTQGRTLTTTNPATGAAIGWAAGTAARAAGGRSRELEEIEFVDVDRPDSPVLDN